MVMVFLYRFQNNFTLPCVSVLHLASACPHIIQFHRLP